METSVIEKKVIPVIEIEKGITIREDKVIETFSDSKLLKPYLTKIAKAVKVDPKSITLETTKGRKEIASRAYKASLMKTNMMNIGKDSITEMKARIKAVNLGVSYVETALNTLRDETRAPLTLWEIEQDRIERERIAGIKEEIQGIYVISTLDGEETIDQLSGLIEAVDNIDCSEGFDEFAADAMKAVIEVKEALSQAMQEIIAENQRQEAEKQKAANDKLLEEERKSVAVETRLNKLRSIPLDYLGKSAEEIGKKLASIEGYKVKEEDFGIRYSEALSDQKTVIDRLTMMRDQALAVESMPAPVVIAVDPAKEGSDETVQAEFTKTDDGVQLTSIEHPETGPITKSDIMQEDNGDEKRIVHYMYAELGMYTEQSEKLARLLMSNRVPCMKYQETEQ